MRVAPIDDGYLHYALSGPAGAPTLVLVNSLGTDLRLWSAIAPHLAPGRRVLGYDFRGHGLSAPADPDWRIERHADDLLALMDRLEIARAAVFGVSVGGQIALAAADRAPARVAGLILADTAARIGDDATWDQRIAQVQAGGMDAMADAILERWFPATYRAANPMAMAAWRAMLTQQTAAGYAATCTALKHADLTDACARVGVPALVLAGTEDAATPPDLVRGLADSLPDARFHEIAGAGHLPMADAPETTADLANRFLAGLG